MGVLVLVLVDSEEELSSPCAAPKPAEKKRIAEATAALRRIVTTTSRKRKGTRVWVR